MSYSDHSKVTKVQKKIGPNGVFSHFSLNKQVSDRTTREVKPAPARNKNESKDNDASGHHWEPKRKNSPYIHELS